MKRFFSLLTVLLALPASAAPELVCDEPAYDFGRVLGEPVISHSFRLENRGRDPLIIRRVVTSCGCTTSGVRKLTIPAGDTAELPFKMDLHGRSGAQRQFITLHTNDPDTPRLSLKVTGTVVPPIEIEPRTLNLKIVNPANLDASSGTVTLTSQTGKPFEVEQVRILNDRVDVDVHHAEDGLSATLAVTPLPQTGDGRFTETLFVHTSHPDVKAKRVLVLWQVRTGVTVAPGVMKLRILPDSSVQQRYMMVSGYPGLEEPLEITDVAWEGRKIEIDWKKIPNGWRIHFHDVVAKPDMHGDTIRIKTNAPDHRELTVPVRVSNPGSSM